MGVAAGLIGKSFNDESLDPLPVLSFFGFQKCWDVCSELCLDLIGDKVGVGVEKHFIAKVKDVV